MMLEDFCKTFCKWYIIRFGCWNLSYIVSFALQLANSGVSAKTLQKHCKLETKPILQKVDITHFIYCNLGPTAIILNKLCFKTSWGMESGVYFLMMSDLLMYNITINPCGMRPINLDEEDIDVLKKCLVCECNYFIFIWLVVWWGEGTCYQTFYNVFLQFSPS